MEEIIKETKEAYWKIRNKSQDAFNKALSNLKSNHEYQKIIKELEKLNKIRESKIEYHLCIYKIHPDDLKKADFTEQDRGSYIDTLYRSSYIGGCPVLESDDEIPFPMPNKPLKTVMVTGITRELILYNDLFSLPCITCGHTSQPPTGFYCKEHLININDIQKENEFDIEKIESLIMKTSCSRIKHYRKTINSYNSLETTISVHCDSYFNGDVTIRLVLDSATRMNICKGEHQFDPETFNEKCKNCDMLNIDELLLC